MPVQIYDATYYYTTVKDEPGEACKLLNKLAQEEVNLLAFEALPTGNQEAQLMIFPWNTSWLARVARRNKLWLDGPHRAFIVHGDDELGALVEIHQKLSDAHINVVTSSGVTDGRGGYGYILHVRHEDYEEVARLLGV